MTSEEDFEAVMNGLCDRLIINFRKVPNWDMFVTNMETKKKDIELEWEMSTEQLAAMYVWRGFNVYLKPSPTGDLEDSEVGNDFEDIPEDATEEEIADRYIYALASWVLEFEREELSWFLKEGDFKGLAEALLGIYSIGIQVGDQTSVVEVDVNKPSKYLSLPPLGPLSDDQINELLRKRLGG